MWIDTHGWTQDHALVVVCITHVGHFFQVSSGQLFCFAWF